MSSGDIAIGAVAGAAAVVLLDRMTDDNVNISLGKPRREEERHRRGCGC